MDLTKQNNNLTHDLLKSGYTILKNIILSYFLIKMQISNPEMFREKQLYNKDLDEVKISNVLQYWIDGTKLIPPTILLSKSNELFPTDGKHRLNVAYYFEAKYVPIFVINKELKKIKEILSTGKTAQKSKHK